MCNHKYIDNIHSFCQIAQVGISVTADIPYGITLRTTFYVCTPNDSDIKDDACVDASHGWQQIDITFAAFYQLPTLFPVSFNLSYSFSIVYSVFSLLGGIWRQNHLGFSYFYLELPCSRGELNLFFVCIY